jgi:hypothetical protein
MKRLAFALAALVLSLGACELLLRLAGYSAPIWYRPDAMLGWAMRPGAHGWFTKEGRAYAQINAEGFRDRTHSVRKPAGTYRIAVLGDSAVEAFQVDLEATFWWKLQDALRSCTGRKVEALAFGVSGYGTGQQALLLEALAMRYQPDLVLLAFAPNDLRNNSPRLETERQRPFFTVDGGELRLDDSFRKRGDYIARASRGYEAYRDASDWLRLVQLVQAARHGLDTIRQANAAARSEGAGIAGIEPTTPIALFSPPGDAAWDEAWTLTEKLIVRMKDYAARHDARFVLAPISHSAQVHPDAATRKRLQDALGVPDLFYIERRLEALGRAAGFPVIALAPELQRRAEAEKVYFHGFPNYRVGWGHWNEQGHAAAAAVLAQRLCSTL